MLSIKALTALAVISFSSMCFANPFGQTLDNTLTAIPAVSERSYADDDQVYRNLVIGYQAVERIKNDLAAEVVLWDLTNASSEELQRLDEGEGISGLLQEIKNSITEFLTLPSQNNRETLLIEHNLLVQKCYDYNVLYERVKSNCQREGALTVARIMQMRQYQMMGLLPR